MKRYRGVLLLLIGALLLSACSGANATQEGQVENQAKAVPVETLDLQEAMIVDEYFLLGQVEAGRTYTLTAPAGQEVETVFVKVGDTVAEGEVLFELARETFDNTASAQRTNAKASLDAARINFENAAESLEDNHALFKNGAISQAQYDQSKSAYDSAQITYNNAREQYRSTLETLENQSDDLTVTSPISGVVVTRSIEEGETSAGQSVITISEMDPVTVRGTVPASQIQKVEEGQAVRLYLPSLEEERTGRIESVTLTAAAGGYPIEIELANRGGKLLPGMVAEVYLELERVTDALVVPVTAVLEDGGQKVIFTEVDGKAVQVPVTLGIRSGERVQVLGDLDAGAHLIVKGQHYLKDGDAVQVKDQ